MTARLTVRYLLLFTIVLAAVSVVAYVLLGQMYRAELQPALGTPEYGLAYATAMRHVAFSIVLFDLPLLLLVGSVSYALAHATVQPLLAARDRERRFAAEAAHELRSPLATIASVAQAVRADAAVEMKPHLETISRTALDASAIVTDLLTLAREPGSHALHKEPVDIALLAMQCADEFRERARERGVFLSVDAASAIVDGDERRIREVLRNLLDNALRHARSRVTLHAAQNGRSAVVSVSDDGVGIDPALHEQIFERFYRVDGSTEGLGLGLSIGRWIATAHGGNLRAAPAAQGALFILSLPAR